MTTTPQEPAPDQTPDEQPDTDEGTLPKDDGGKDSDTTGGSTGMPPQDEDDPA